MLYKVLHKLSTLSQHCSMARLNIQSLCPCVCVLCHCATNGTQKLHWIRPLDALPTFRISGIDFCKPKPSHRPTVPEQWPHSLKHGKSPADFYFADKKHFVFLTVASTDNSVLKIYCFIALPCTNGRQIEYNDNNVTSTEAHYWHGINKL